MAECHHTPESCPVKVKYPRYRQLTIQETICDSAVKIRGTGINYVPVNLEPCIVLKGKWLKKAGFFIGGKVTLVINPGEVIIIPKLST